MVLLSCPVTYRNCQQGADCKCEAALKDAALPMPEDWAQEVALLKDCGAAALESCAEVKPGRAQLYRCLQ